MNIANLIAGLKILSNYSQEAYTDGGVFVWANVEECEKNKLESLGWSQIKHYTGDNYWILSD